MKTTNESQDEFFSNSLHITAWLISFQICSTDETPGCKMAKNPEPPKPTAHAVFLEKFGNGIHLMHRVSLQETIWVLHWFYLPVSAKADANLSNIREMF